LAVNWNVTTARNTRKRIVMIATESRPVVSQQFLLFGTHEQTLCIWGMVCKF